MLTRRKDGEDGKLVGRPILNTHLGIVNADNKFIQLPTYYSSTTSAYTLFI
jgi:hypothetical protein